MNSSRITYTAWPDATLEAKLNALAACFRFILASHERKRAAPASRPDARKKDPDASGNVSICR